MSALSSDMTSKMADFKKFYLDYKSRDAGSTRAVIMCVVVAALLAFGSSYCALNPSIIDSSSVIYFGASLSAFFLLMGSVIGAKEKEAMLSSLALLILGLTAGALTQYVSGDLLKTLCCAPAVVAGFLGVMRALVLESRDKTEEMKMDALGYDFMTYCKDSTERNLKKVMLHLQGSPNFINQEDREGVRLLDIALISGNDIAIGHLEELGADKTQINWRGLLRRAVANGNTASMEAIYRYCRYAKGFHAQLIYIRDHGTIHEDARQRLNDLIVAKEKA